jgi:hypothetical protein
MASRREKSSERSEIGPAEGGGQGRANGRRCDAEERGGRFSSRPQHRRDPRRALETGGRQRAGERGDMTLEFRVGELRSAWRQDRGTIACGLVEGKPRDGLGHASLRLHGSAGYG